MPGSAASAGPSARTTPSSRACEADKAQVNERLKLLWLGIGKEDRGLKNKQALAAALKEMGIKHEYHETEGRTAGASGGST